MKHLLMDTAITVGIVVVTMAVINRSPLAPYVAGTKKIFGVL